MTTGDTIFWTEKIYGRTYARIGTVAARRGHNVRTLEGNMRKVADVVRLPHHPTAWPKDENLPQSMYRQLPLPDAVALLADAGIEVESVVTQ